MARIGYMIRFCSKLVAVTQKSTSCFCIILYINKKKLNSKFKTACKDDTGELTELNRKKIKRWYYPASHRLNVNVILS